MTDPDLNQVLLNPKCCTKKAVLPWLNGWGGKGLLNAVNAPENIIKTIKEAHLLGLGGSGFPTYIKWQSVADNVAPDKYLICNGNEDEPGTFKDRVLLEQTPFQLIEGATIAAIACGINHVVFYINPHLENAIQVVSNALKEWQSSDIYARVLQTLDVTISYTIVKSNGIYIGGEETAVIQTIEGKFPFPTGKPPYPTEQGVYGSPTLINNIETLCNVPHIMRNGAQWFYNLGRNDSAGTKLYTISGDVESPGVYELPMGISLSELIDKYGSGMLHQTRLKSVITGGPSNSMLTAKDLDVSLDFTSLESRGASLGTGAMIVISDADHIVQSISEYVNFFAGASCGQCPPCKTGTYFLAQIIAKIDSNKATYADLEQLTDLCRILPGSGKCHLVDGAVKLVKSSLNHFKDEYEKLLIKRE